MHDIPQYRQFLAELAGRWLQHNPHLLARMPYPLSRTARHEAEPAADALRCHYGGADEKKGSG